MAIAEIARTENVIRGIVLMIGATMVFSIQDALTKVLVQDYPVQQVLWVRYLFFAVFAIALSARTKPLRRILHTARPVYQITRSVIVLIPIACFALAVRVLPLADAHAIIASSPLFATALSAVWLAEKVGMRRWVAVFIGFTGMLLILRPGLTALQPASLLVLNSAFFYAVYAVMTKIASRGDDGETSLLYMALVGAAVLTVIGPFFWVNPTIQGLGFMAALGLAGTIAHFLLIKALEVAPASLLQPFNYLMVVWAMTNGFLIFGDFPDIWTIAGSAVIVGSGLYVIYRERRAANPSS